MICLMSLAWTANADTSATPALPPIDSCPVNVDFNDDERLALRLFLNRLERMMPAYGKANFQSLLNSTISNYFPDKTVIEISPAFYERIIHLVDQQYLWNDIEMTIGKNDPMWWRDFKPMMQSVTHFNYPLRSFNRPKLKALTEALVDRITSLTASQMRKRGLTEDEANVIKARTVKELEEVYMYIDRWDQINAEISRVKMNNTLARIFMIGLTLAPGGLLIGTTIRSAMIIAKASQYAASFATDAVVAARLGRTGQILAGAGLGAVGAPAGLMVTDISSMLLEAGRNSRNNDTLYICELDKQIQAFRQRGVAPYLKATVIGGSIGLGGGALTLTATGARAVLYATTFGVGVAQLYSVGAVSVNTIYALSEFRQAQEALDRGDREAAVQHLRAARQYTVGAREAFLNSLIIGILTGAIAKDFGVAMRHGEEIIRALYASSADTLPLAMENAQDALELLIQQNSSAQN
jgi:hypothetical protein